MATEQMTITFELTRQPKLLNSYYHIRETCFRRELNLQHFNGDEDHFDRLGWIVIARDGDRCIGGARINGCTPQAPFLLPMENEGFLARQLFPQLKLEKQGYCQWTRLALLPEYRSPAVVRELCLALPRVSAVLGFNYAFNIADQKRSRLYRRVLGSEGIDYQICNNLEIPAEKDFHGLEHLLSMARIKGHGQQTVRIDRTAIARSAFTPFRTSRLRRPSRQIAHAA